MWRYFDKDLIVREGIAFVTGVIQKSVYMVIFLILNTTLRVVRLVFLFVSARKAQSGLSGDVLRSGLLRARAPCISSCYAIASMFSNQSY